MAKEGPPNIFEGLTFIWRSIVDPCDAPLTVYIQLAGEPLLNAFITYFAFDLKQLLQGYVRPAKAWLRTRNKKHYGRGKKGRRGPFGNKWKKVLDYDPHNELGKRLPGAAHIRGRDVGAGLAWLWRFEGAIARVNFWLMVLSILYEFLIAWFSAIWESEYCQSQGDSVLSAKNDLLVTVPPAGWVGSIFDETEKERNMSFWNGNGFTPAAGEGAAAYTADATIPGGSGEGTVGIRLVCTSGPHLGLIVQDIKPIKDGATVELGVSVPCSAGDLWIPQDRSNGVFCNLVPSIFCHCIVPKDFP